MPLASVSSNDKGNLYWEIAVITLLIVSLILIGNIVVCAISPSNYSAYNVENRVPLRSITTVTPKDPDILRSCVSFTEAPITTKLTYIITVDANNRVHYVQRNEYRLTRNAAVQCNFTTRIKYDEVHDISASLDGNSLTLGTIEINGTKYYAIPNFNLTKINEVKTLTLLFTEEYSPISSGAVNIPWVFNNNYAKIEGFTLPTIPVENGSESDICELRIDFNTPYMTVLPEHSGWLDAFTNSQTGLTYDSQNNPIYVMSFEYPINQTITKNTNPYTFQTYFSEQNQPNQPTVTVIPNPFGVPFLFFSFFALS